MNKFKKILYLFFICIFLTNCVELPSPSDKKGLNDQEEEVEYNKEEQPTKKDTRSKAELKKAYSDILIKSAKRVHSKIDDVITPQSGRKHQQIVDLDDIDFNPETNTASANVLLKWEARSVYYSVPYGVCELSGRIHVTIPKTSTSIGKIKFFAKDYNNHLARVSYKNEIDWVKKGVIIDY